MAKIYWKCKTLWTFCKVGPFRNSIYPRRFASVWNLFERKITVHKQAAISRLIVRRYTGWAWNRIIRNHKDSSKTRHRAWISLFSLYYRCVLSSIMTQFRLHRCNVWFLDDRSYCRSRSTARRVEGGHWITWWGRLKIDFDRHTLCVGEVLSLAGEATRRKVEGSERERKGREGRSSNTAPDVSDFLAPKNNSRLGIRMKWILR